MSHSTLSPESNAIESTPSQPAADVDSTHARTEAASTPSRLRPLPAGVTIGRDAALALLKAVVSRARSVVVKVGSSVLTRGTLTLDRDHLAHLAGEIAAVLPESTTARANKKSTGSIPNGRPAVTLVSSGSVALGFERLAQGARKPGLSRKQAAAAVGQGHLIRLWDEAFARFDRMVAQVLLTQGDFADRKRFLNARHTLSELLAQGVVPIINENDTVASNDHRVGDNDRLAALVASAIGADLLILLTDVDGMYDCAPSEPGARLLPCIDAVSDEVLALAGSSSTTLGTGGMQSKLLAARAAAQYGVSTVIANGRTRGLLSALFGLAKSGGGAGDANGDAPIGTLVCAADATHTLPARKHWIAHNQLPSGTITIDAGAVTAIVERKRSLLPPGITRVMGDFDVGDLVRIVGPDGREVARGLASYPARDMRLLCGKPSRDIERILGYRYDDEAVHREDLVLLR